MNDSSQLLAKYVRTGSETAFRELVTRYVDLVHSAAIRLVDGDAHRAEDVTQTVFVDLARKAPTLSANVMLGGWLHRHTCYVAATVMRGERRRQSRERQAVEMNALQDHSEANLKSIAPILDEAIDQLGTEDRAAILLRFFEQRDFRAVGDALGSNEEAARKRVSRALDKLHALLKQRGVAFPVVTLGTVLAAGAVTAAPAGMAIAISSTAVASAAGTGTLTLLKMLTMTNVKFAMIGAVASAAIAAAPLAIQHQSQARLREENQSLRSQAEQVAALTEENERLQRAPINDSRSLAQDQLNELLRLRGEVGELRRKSGEAERLREEIQAMRAHAAFALLDAGLLVQVNPPIAVDPQNECINQLRQIDGAKQQYALENGLTQTNTVSAEQILLYIGRQPRTELPSCPAGGTYTLGRLGEEPTCTIAGHTISQPLNQATGR